MRAGWKGPGFGTITDNPTRTTESEKKGSLKERMLEREKKMNKHSRIKKKYIMFFYKVAQRNLFSGVTLIMENLL